MSMYCPKCEKINKCDCINCNPGGDVTDVLLKDGIWYKCSFCDHKFNHQDSLDFEWNKMIKDFSEKANPVVCLQWVILKNNLTENYLKNRYTKECLEKSIGISEFGFQKAFAYHFKINYQDVNQLVLKQLKLKLKRDNVLNSILK